MKQETRRLVSGLCMLAVTSAVAVNVRAHSDIHVWTDENGRVHYSNVPATRAADRIIPAAPQPDPGEQVSAQREAEQARQNLNRWESTRSKSASTEPENLVTCDRALHIIDFLRSYHELPVLRPLDSGEVTWLTDDQRELHLSQARREVETRCSSAREVDMNDLWTGLYWPRTARRGVVTPTRFLPKPGVTEPSVTLKGGRTRTTPQTPTTSTVDARRPTAPTASDTSLVSARRPAAPAATGVNGLK